MHEEARRIIQSIPDDQLLSYAHAVLAWQAQQPHAVGESRARAVLRAANVVDDTDLGDFAAALRHPAALRVALFDLLDTTDLTGLTGVRGAVAAEPPAVDWLALAVMAYAAKIGYLPDQLDPASPPVQFTPAGQVLHLAGQWVRRQGQRTATERDKLARKLAYDGSVAPTPPTAADDVPAVRAQIPVRHFEFNDPVSVAPDELDQPQPPPVVLGAPVSISAEDVTPPPAPDLDIKVGESRRVGQPPAPPSATPGTAPSVRQALSQNLPEIRDSVVTIANALATSVRNQFKSEPMPTVRLRVVVRATPDGAGMPSVQVKIRAEGVKSYVAGVTNSDGLFIIELPVRARAGLTYHADVTWPAALGGQTERKSLTLNTHRTEFQLTFYHRLA